MKVITLHQPWAQLIVIGAKKYETRSWQTSHRGPILIHAGRKYMADCQRLSTLDPFFTCLYNAGFKPPALPLGAIVGMATIVDCQPTEKLTFDGLVTDQERQFGDFRDGRWAWRLESHRTFPVPIPHNGQRGVFDILDSQLPQEVLDMLPKESTPESKAICVD